MSQQSSQILDDILIFYKKLLIPYMKIRRDMPFPTEPERMETDGEHAFSLAMVAISLNERLSLKLDTGKIAQYALVHDLVEVHAGDVSVKAAEEDHAKKEANEEEALKQIEQDFANVFPWVHTMIAKYEAKADDESRLVYIADKYMGWLNWLAGEGQNWAQYYPDKEGILFQKVAARLRKKAEKYENKDLLDLFNTIHERMEHNREEFYKSSMI